PAYWRKTLRGRTPAQFAETINRRVLTVGAITALVPRTMIVLNTRPGKPDPFAELRGDDRLLLLMAQWSPEQWAKAGSDAGIGASDLTGEQRPLFAGMFPAETVPVRTFSVEQDEKYGEVSQLTDESETVPAAALRLRLSRRMKVYLPEGEGGSSYHDLDILSGESGLRRVSPTGTPTKQELALPDTDDGYTLTRRDSAFGVRLLLTEPSRLKPGQLAFDSPRLRVPVPLADGIRTVSDLIALVAKTTRLELVADKRYAAYPVAVRGGRSVRAGDLLLAVCRSVNGTFRKLTDEKGASVYLLTDDIEGYGTRLKRISEWAREPGAVRDKALLAAGSNFSRTDPLLAFVSFGKNDPLTPTPEQAKRLDGIRGSRVNISSTTVTSTASNPSGDVADTEYGVSDLPPAQQSAVRAALENRQRTDKSANPVASRVVLGSALRYEWVAPDGRAFGIKTEGRLSFIGSTFPVPKAMAAMASTAGAGNKPPALVPLSAGIKRGVALSPLPATDAETTETLDFLRRKGFTEAWFRVPFAPDAPERTVFAVDAGKKAE
ncbi:MAG: hypothetical protein H7Y38_15840, partial [Armatimonadetes bacterium]|nr:hypothetical protein [Armatimonadota bacterium]